MSDAPLPPVPDCPLCGKSPTRGTLGLRGTSVWCIGPCPLSYGTFTPDEWRRLAAPPVHDTVRELLRAVASEDSGYGSCAKHGNCGDRMCLAVNRWIAAGRPGLEEKK